MNGLVVSGNQEIPTSRVVNISHLSLFQTPKEDATDWVVCHYAPMHGTVMQKGTFVGALEDTINAQLTSHFNVVVRAKLGRILLPNMTQLYVKCKTAGLTRTSNAGPHRSLYESCIGHMVSQHA